MTLLPSSPEIQPNNFRKTESELQGTPTFRKMETGRPLENENFHCCAEWHLSCLPPVCSSIYPLAYRLTSDDNEPDRRSKTKTFYASAESLAVFFGYSPAQIRRGLKELVHLGFLELLKTGRYRTNVYRVVSHEEWARKHPGGCTRKIEIDYFSNDPLGPELLSASGGRIRFPEFSVSNLRKLGLPDHLILERFAEFWRDTGSSCRERDVPTRFYMWLKNSKYR